MSTGDVGLVLVDDDVVRFTWALYDESMTHNECDSQTTPNDDDGRRFFVESHATTRHQINR